VQENCFLSVFGAGLDVVCTFSAELYCPLCFFDTGVVISRAFALVVVDVGVDAADFGFVGVSKDFKMFTFPLVFSSAFTTSPGKFVITLLLDLNLSIENNMMISTSNGRHF
jgi:hypothetical protein